MSKLPNGWQESTLGEIAQIVGGGTPATTNSDYFSNESGIAWLTPADLSGFTGISISRGKRFLTDAGLKNSSARLMPKGTVLFSSRAPIGYVAIASNEICTNQGFKSLIPKEGIVSEYLYFYMRYAKPLAEKLASGTTFPEISGKNVARIKFLFPPLNEQKRMVEKLEKLLGRVEAVQARLDKIPAILKRFRQSVLAAACSGKLTADWRDSLSIEELPDSWKNDSLGQHSELITKGASPKWQGINYASEGVLFVTSENVGAGKLLLERPKFVEEGFNIIQKRSILRNGDLLTNIVGASIGRTALYDRDDLANINQAVALIRLKENISREYVLMVLNSPVLVQHMNEEKVDVARANLSLKDVAGFPLPLPPLEEQEEIVRRVEELFKFADAVEERYKKAKAHTDKLNQSILAKAFRGELVPQDPNDEPAAALLKRLAKEMAAANANGGINGPLERRNKKSSRKKGS